MLTYEEEEAEREYWNEVRWEERNHKSFYRTVIKKDTNGNEIEWHFAGDHLMGKYDHHTGRMVK
jgi:hypothetical protein